MGQPVGYAVVYRMLMPQFGLVMLVWGGVGRRRRIPTTVVDRPLGAGTEPFSALPGQTRVAATIAAGLAALGLLLALVLGLGVLPGHLPGRGRCAGPVVGEQLQWFLVHDHNWVGRVVGAGIDAQHDAPAGSEGQEQAQAGAGLVLMSVALVLAAAVSVALEGRTPLRPHQTGERTSLLAAMGRLLGADDAPAAEVSKGSVRRAPPIHRPGDRQGGDGRHRRGDRERWDG